MRRFVALLLSLLTILTMAATGSAASDPRVLFDEQEIQFDANPYVENGRTLVPVRALAERLGFTVGWDEGEQKITLTKGSTTILFWIGSNKVVVNGKEGTVDVPPTKVNDRTFVPVRFVSERLGAHVAWDEKQNTAVVTSGKALWLKVNKKQQQATDQKMTGDVQVQAEISAPDQAKSAGFSLKIPMHMEMQIYHNDMLMTMNMQMPSIGQTTTGPLSMQIAIKDGKIYNQNPLTQQWQQTGSIDISKGTVEFGAALGQTGFGDLLKVAETAVQDAEVSVGGEEEVDGVKAIRLDVDLSKTKIGAFMDKFLATIPASVGSKPDLKLNVDRYQTHLWVNPETLFVHKTTLDLAMTMVMSDATQKMSATVEMKGELRAKAVSEPIKFPDFSAPSYSVEEKLAAKVYWDGLDKNVPMQPCFTAATEADAHWKDKNYEEGRTKAVVAAGCFIQHRMALSGMKPPKEFVEGHKTLGVTLETFEKAYATFGQAFDLAAKGDLTGSDTKKAEAAKLAATAQQSLSTAVMQMAQGAAKYGLLK